MFDNPHLPDDRVPRRVETLYDALPPDAVYLLAGESAGEEFDDPFCDPAHEPI